jgi:hypothetical protein
MRGMADHRVRVVWEFESKLQHCEVRCGGCGRAVIYPPKMAVARFGALTHLNQLAKRLRCTQCGAKGASVRGVYREAR